MTDLRAIAVRVNDYGRDCPDEDDGHVVITLEPASWMVFENEECTPREWRLACLDIAGIIGRVAVGLAPFVAESAHRHRCVKILGPPNGDTVFDSPYLSGCELSGSEETVRPGSFMDYHPALYVRVPREDVPLWLQRIRELLEAIAEDANDLDALDPLEDQNRDTPTTTTTTTDHANSSALDGATSVGAHQLVAHAWTDDGSGVSCRQCGMPRAYGSHPTCEQVAS